MSFWGRHVSVKLIGTAVVVLLLGAFAVALTRPAPRDITLVVRGMAFYLEGDSLPNPTIQLTAGERVRITLRNEERAIRHDVALPAMAAALVGFWRIHALIGIPLSIGGRSRPRSGSSSWSAPAWLWPSGGG